MKRLFGLLSFIVLIFSLIFVVGKFLKAEDKLQEQSEINTNAIKKKIKKPIVRVRACIKTQLIEKIFASGMIRGSKEIKLTSKVIGVVEKVFVKNGQSVKKGELILRLNQDKINLKVQREESKLRSAKQDFLLRLNDLNKIFTKNESKLISNWLNNTSYSLKQELIKDLDEKVVSLMERTKFLDATLSLANMKLEQSYHAIRAPFSGRISEFSLQVASTITSSNDIALLSKTNQLIAEVGIMETDIAKIEVGNSAEIIFQNKLSKGKIISVAKHIQKENRLNRVDILFPNTQNIPSGAFVKCYLYAGKRKEQLLVPKEALITRDDKKLIFIARENKAIWCYVKIGKENNEYVEILSNKMNLRMGDQIIVDGQFSLAHQSDIEIFKK